MRLQFPDVGDIDCCLCALATPENQQHLFGECNWIGEVRGSLSRWAGIPIPAKNVEDCMRWIKNRQWRQFRKELAAALYGALIYYAWQARNWRVYRGLNVDTRFITTQIQKEIRERVSLFIGSRKARRCQVLIQRISN